MSEMPGGNPELSVVVVTLESSERLVACLTALSRQTGAPPLEIIVPWDGSHGEAPAASRFPLVRFLRVDGRRTYAELRALGVTESRGRIVAITEDHCVPAMDWCARIMEAHRGPHAAVGGTVEKEAPDTVLNWSFYLADYLRYMNPMPEGPARHLTDCNVTYKRASLESIREVWHGEFHENTVHEALLALGQSMWLDPGIVVHQKRNMSWPAAVRDRYAFGRLLGSTRASGMSRLDRSIRIASTVLLPALLVGRTVSQILHKRRCLGAFLRALPALTVISVVWACGELMGYVTGVPDRSLARQGTT